MPLALFSPLPRPVTLAGKVYRARPLRIRDLFALADLAAGEPPGAPEGADAGALKAAFDAAEAWPPSWTEALRTDAGYLYALRVCLRDSGLDNEAVVRLAGEMNPADWRRLVDLALGTDPAATAANAIDGFIGVVDEVESIPFPEAVAQFWADHPGLSEEALLDVSLPMFRLARSGGQRNIVNPDSSGETQAARAKFWANGFSTN